MARPVEEGDDKSVLSARVMTIEDDPPSLTNTKNPPLGGFFGFGGGSFG